MNVKFTISNQHRREYFDRPYLEHESSHDLLERHKNIIGNAYRFDLSGVLAPSNNEFYLRRLAHVYAEAERRGLHIELEVIRIPEYPNAQRAAEVWQPLNLAPGSYLLKFGSRKWMVPLLEKGELLIGNAKKYESQDLGPAIRDKETEFEQKCYGITVGVPESQADPRGRQKMNGPVIGYVKMTAQWASDYMMACFGMEYDCRLYDDFSQAGCDPYDSCLVIKQPQRFIDRLRACGQETWPAWEFANSYVSYRDPHGRIGEPVGLPFCKHFRFGYQKEYRTVWMPPKPDPSLSSTRLTLGPLTDYCELLTL